MRSRKAFLVMGVSLILAVAPLIPAHATPFRFEFVLPNWTTSSNSALYGANATVDVTVNNGSATPLNQTYENGQITQVHLTTAGTFANTWTQLDPGLSVDISASFISTNAAGIPTLNLLAGPAARVVFSNPNGTWQFGRRFGLGGFTQTWVQDGPNFSGNDLAFNNTEEGFSIVGTNLTAPAPATLTLMALGFAGLCWKRRRRD